MTPEAILLLAVSLPAGLFCLAVLVCLEWAERRKARRPRKEARP